MGKFGMRGGGHGRGQGQPIRRLDRWRGALLGLAVGDALGTTLEFSRPGTFDPVTDMVGGGPFDLAPGQWTDDTSMALCLAESLVEQGGFDPVDQMRRYLRWRDHGHLSSTGECFDIGNTVDRALETFRETGDPFAGPADPWSAGNGSLMRIAPIALRWAHAPEEAVRWAGQCSKTTHGAPAAVDACRYFTGLLVGALRGEPLETLLSPMYEPVAGLWEREPLCPEIERVARGSWRGREPPEIRGSGYVVHCLEAALWALGRSGGFEEACLRAVNLGEDADTTGAVCGQLAGAVFGAGGIPGRWLERLAMRERVEALADALLDACESEAQRRR